MKITNAYYDKVDMFKSSKNNDLTTYSYLHGGIDFTDKRNRLARGLTLDSNNNVILVGFEKFFCENQLDDREEYTNDFKNRFTRLCNNGSNYYTCIEKLDGTMIIVGEYNNDLIYSTTSGTNTEQSIIAKEYFDKLPNKNKIKDYLHSRQSCFVFEYISKFNRIAVDYNVDIDMVLLAEISKTDFSRMKIENEFNFTRPKIYRLTYSRIKNIQKNKENFEGFVIENEYGNLIKVKTDWWYKNHNIFDLFNHRNYTKNDLTQIINAILDNTIDDLISLENSNEYYKELNKVGKIYTIYLDIINTGITLYAKYNGDNKAFFMNEDKASFFMPYINLVLNKKNILVSKIINDILTVLDKKEIKERI